MALVLQITVFIRAHTKHYSLSSLAGMPEKYRTPKLTGLHATFKALHSLGSSPTIKKIKKFGIKLTQT